MLSLIWQGAITGLLYAIASLGLVMVFKSSHMVNFAHGSMAGFCAFIVYMVTSGLEWPWFAGVLIALVTAVALAAIAYFAIAPLITKEGTTATIATLGLGLMLQGLILSLFGANIVNLDLPLPSWSMQVFGLRITLYELVILGVSTFIVVFLFLLIDRTRLGIAFRTVSTNAFAAEVCGLSIRRVHLFAWVASAILGVIAAVLIVPTTFLSSTTVTTFMLQAFAATVIGGFDSLPGSIIGGILVGIATNLFAFYVAPEFMNTFLLVFIFTSLTIFPGGILSRRAGGRV
ncbi:branched-chain amino acid ABC transporter permease [Bosea thiooxidans]